MAELLSEAASDYHDHLHLRANPVFSSSPAKQTHAEDKGVSTCTAAGVEPHDTHNGDDLDSRRAKARRRWRGRSATQRGRHTRPRTQSWMLCSELFVWLIQKTR